MFGSEVNIEEYLVIEVEKDYIWEFGFGIVCSLFIRVFFIEVSVCYFRLFIRYLFEFLSWEVRKGLSRVCGCIGWVVLGVGLNERG